jgi:hypothetical protein
LTARAETQWMVTVVATLLSKCQSDFDVSDPSVVSTVS